MIPYTTHETLFSVGPYEVQTEFIAIIFAFTVLVVLVFLELNKQKEKMGLKEYSLFFFIIIFSALAGGRIWYYAQNWEGPHTLIDFLNFFFGGLVSIGMLLGGTLGILIWIKIKKKKSHHFFKFADVLTIYTALWIFIFRLFGCFIDGHIIGKETKLPWALQFADGSLQHPVALYLALSGLFIFIILKIFFRKEKTTKNKLGKRFDGEIALWFLFLYCFNRFWIEFTMVGEALCFGLSWVQYVCMVLFIFAFLRLAYNYFTYHTKKA